MATIFWRGNENFFSDYDKKRSPEAKKPRILEFVQRSHERAQWPEKAAKVFDDLRKQGQQSFSLRQF
jgi:hypothetical protein